MTDGRAFEIRLNPSKEWTTFAAFKFYAPFPPPLHLQTNIVFKIIKKKKFFCNDFFYFQLRGQENSKKKKLKKLTRQPMLPGKNKKKKKRMLDNVWEETFMHSAICFNEKYCCFFFFFICEDVWPRIELDYDNQTII